MTRSRRGVTFVATLATLTGAGVLAFGAGNTAPAAKSASKMTKKQKIGYTIGYQIGKSFEQQGVDVAAVDVAEGIRAGMGKAKPKMDAKTMQSVMSDFRQAMMKKAVAKHQAEAAKNAKASAAFLKANANKPGVHVTKSGLQYKILKPGQGTSPAAGDTVKVKYKGTLPSGEKFDASADHGGPATFKVNQVIPGWTEALEMMKPGAKWRIWVPAKLAYGEQGTRGGPIGPNQALVFDVELVKVTKAKAGAKSSDKSAAPSNSGQ